VVRLGPKLAKKGTFTSKVFDASQISRWGTLDVTQTDTTAADLTGLTVQTRTSVIANPEDPGWSEWSTPVKAGESLFIHSPIARYIQYRLNYEPKGNTSAVVAEVQIAYMQDNRRPDVTSVTVNTGQVDKSQDASEGPDGEGPPVPMMAPKMPMPKNFRFTWKASDPNGDQLRYNISLRRIGSPYWIQLEKDFTPMMMTWDPRSVPDGKYEIKVVASDKLANPVGMGLIEARVSNPFVVDNTPPVIKNLSAKLTAPGKLLIQADLSDEWTEISNGWILVNASKNWQYVAPANELYDNKNERIETIIPVKPVNGPILLSIKVADRAGNIGYGWILVPKTPHPSDAIDHMETKRSE
jgi:hypothetical protein